MHPILGHFRRLVLYLAAWGPISAVITYLFVALGGMTWVLALALSIPLCLYYAFVCLSAWYMCRSIRLQNSASWLTHFAAAAVAGIVWKAVAIGLAIALSSTPTAGARRGRRSRRTSPSRGPGSRRRCRRWRCCGCSATAPTSSACAAPPETRPSGCSMKTSSVSRSLHALDGCASRVARGGADDREVLAACLRSSCSNS